ncbi:MAG TPA: hypothetical protein VKU80_17230 [Planctomycetota bacterium]|nr:hypothetical protein [Planctomycetota bacterium]
MIRFAAVALALLEAVAVQADETPIPPPRMPIREITVFKDGHALLLHEGEMPVSDAGHVVVDGLPVPVMGSFWPYSADPAATLASVIAGRQNIKVERDAATIPDLLNANKGGQVTIALKSRESCTGTLVSLTGSLALVKTLEGLRPLPLEAIDTVTLRDKSETRLTEEVSRAALTLRLDWGANAPPRRARVGMMYLQKGIRWIPSYRIEIDGKSQAKVQLKATLINEIADLENVDAHLVVGVPSFVFKESPDPVSLQRTVAELSRYFQPDSQTAYAFGNALYSQSERASQPRAPGPAPEAPAGDGSPEDVFVFPVKKVSLKKGECLVLPVAEFKVEYKDVYAVDIPLTPPRDAQAFLSGRPASELERLYQAPKAMHKIRLMNRTAQPITTAPALILQGGRVLAQGMTTYTSPGGSSDLEVTTSLDFQVKKTESEKERIPNALQWQGNRYQQIGLDGQICLTNYRAAPVEIEVRRVVLGEVGPPSHGGTVEKINLMEDPKAAERYPYSAWSTSYTWWNQINPVSRVSWKVMVEPGKSVDLLYSWKYYWN